MLDEAKGKLSKLQVIWVDQRYSGKNLATAVEHHLCGEHVRLEVIERISKTFKQLPKRWIIERTFGWLKQFGRLSKDYEMNSEVSEAMIYGSLLRLMVKRLVA